MKHWRWQLALTLIAFLGVLACASSPVTKLDESKFASSDPEIICEHYCHFLTDLLVLTPRPIKSQITIAVLEVFEDAARPTAEMFAERMAAAIGHCRYIAKSFRTGA